MRWEVIRGFWVEIWYDLIFILEGLFGFCVKNRYRGEKWSKEICLEVIVVVLVKDFGSYRKIKKR